MPQTFPGHDINFVALILPIIAIAVSSFLYYDLHYRRKIAVILSLPQTARDAITTFIVIANESNRFITIERIEFKRDNDNAWSILPNEELPCVLKPCEAKRLDTTVFDKKNNIVELIAIDSFGKKWECSDKNIAEIRLRIEHFRTVLDKRYPSMVDATKTGH